MATGARQPVHAPDKFQELDAGQAVEEQAFVGHQADALLDFQFLRGQRVAEDLDLSAIGRNQAR